jgi:hypothetical protein
MLEPSERAKFARGRQGSAAKGIVVGRRGVQKHDFGFRFGKRPICRCRRLKFYDGPGVRKRLVHANQGADERAMAEVENRAEWVQSPEPRCRAWSAESDRRGNGKNDRWELDSFDHFGIGANGPNQPWRRVRERDASHGQGR